MHSLSYLDSVIECAAKGLSHLIFALVAVGLWHFAKSAGVKIGKWQVAATLAGAPFLHAAAVWITATQFFVSEGRLQHWTDDLLPHPSVFGGIGAVIGSLFLVMTADSAVAELRFRWKISRATKKGALTDGDLSGRRRSNPTGME